MESSLSREGHNLCHGRMGTALAGEGRQPGMATATAQTLLLEQSAKGGQQDEGKGNLNFINPHDRGAEAQASWRASKSPSLDTP